MKTKLFVLFTAILTLGTFSSCYAPYGYGRSYRRPYYGSPYRSTNMGGYRGGGSGGGFGGSFGGFNR